MPDIVMEVVFTEGNTELRNREAVTLEGIDKRDVTILDATTDVLVTAAITIATLEAILIVVDQDLTLETNSPSAPVQTFALKSGIPFFWRKGSGITNPITTNVTALYFTNASGGLASGKAKIWIAQDATP